jgi:hypothetical protein
VGLDGCAESLEGADDALRVVRARSQEDAEVACGARLSVNGERVGAHDEVLDPLLVKRREEDDEVLVELRIGHGRFAPCGRASRSASRSATAGRCSPTYRA